MLLTLLLAASAAAAPARVGIFKCQSSAVGKKQATHGFYFEKEKSWKGRKFNERLDPKAKAAKAYATFDGRILAPLEVKESFSSFEKIPPALQKKCDWLKEEGRHPFLLTSSLEKFSDPEGWKPADITPHELKNIGKIVEAYPACARKPAPTEGSLLGHFEIKRSYKAKDGRRLIGLSSICAELKDDAAASWAKDVKQPWAIWFYQHTTGVWVMHSNLDLIDIGDFDGDGKSEGVFQAGYDVPDGTYALVNLENFSDVITAHDDGY